MNYKLNWRLTIEFVFVENIKWKNFAYHYLLKGEITYERMEHLISLKRLLFYMDERKLLDVLENKCNIYVKMELVDKFNNKWWISENKSGFVKQ